MSRIRLTALAVEQHGVLSRRQCLDAGITDRAIAHRLAVGRWTRLHQGVYLTSPAAATFLARAVAALLAAGRDAALSHGSAAYLHGLVMAEPRVLEIVVPADRRVRFPVGVRVRVSSYAADRTDPLAWPWRTTLADTVLDLAAGGSLDAATALVCRSCAMAALTPRAILAALARRTRHRWSADLREVLAEVESGAESPLEVRAVRDVLRAHGLPVGERQLGSPVGASGTTVALGPAWNGERHDLGYEEFGVLFELDGRLGHAGWEGRRRDATRDRRAAGRGWITVRAGWAEVLGGPCRLAIEFGAVLESRGWHGRVRPCRRRDCPARAPRAQPDLGR
jgi:hypothetical protein